MRPDSTWLPGQLHTAGIEPGSGSPGWIERMVTVSRSRGWRTSPRRQARTRVPVDLHLLGAAPGDTLDDLFPASGAVTRAWAACTRQEPLSTPEVYMSCKARADASSPAASDGSYPSSQASPGAYPD